MIWITRLKPFFISGGVSLLIIASIWTWKANTSRSISSKFVVVDTAQLIREESESLAQASISNSVSTIQLQRRLEGFRKHLIENLNTFAREKGVLVFTSNQVFGDLPDVTEEFTAHMKSGERRHG